MHIVSNVTGRLRKGCTGFDLSQSNVSRRDCFGSAENSCHANYQRTGKDRRGCYAGAIGYFGFDGNVRFLHRAALRGFEKWESIFSSRRGHRRRLKSTIGIRGNR